MNVIGIIIAILVFGLIVAIHEFGHFIAAKRSGVRVNEFAIGMGPTILKKTKGETTYSWRLLPIGGFCALEGEDASSEDEHALNNKSVWQRLKIMAAGAFMNLVLGLIAVFILTAMSSYIVVPVVSGFFDTNVTKEQGLMEGDRIVEVDGINIYTTLDLNYAFMMADNSDMKIKVERDGKKVNLGTIKFDSNDTAEKGSIIVDFKVTARKKTPVNFVTSSFKEAFSIGRIVWLSLGDLITGKFSMNDISGPIGVVTVIGDTVSAASNQSIRETVMNLLNLMAFLTINIGIFNLLPIPALDGGRIFFLLIEAVRGKPVKPEHEGMVHFIGIVILFGFMILISFNDILKLIRG